MLYTIAAYTGLRASELASLMPASFDLAAKTVTVRAAYSKCRRDDKIPLHASLIGPITAWLCNRPTAARFGRACGRRTGERPQSYVAT